MDPSRKDSSFQVHFNLSSVLYYLLLLADVALMDDLRRWSQTSSLGCRAVGGLHFLRVNPAAQLQPSRGRCQAQGGSLPKEAFALPCLSYLSQGWGRWAHEERECPPSPLYVYFCSSLLFSLFFLFAFTPFILTARWLRAKNQSESICTFCICLYDNFRLTCNSKSI